MTKLTISTRQEEKYLFTNENYDAIARRLAMPNTFWIEINGGQSHEKEHRIFMSTRQIIFIEEIKQASERSLG